MVSYKHFSVATLLLITLLLGACGGGNTTSNFSSNVDVSKFDGTWYSPCFNNAHSFSARQTITINGTSLISQLESHANAPASTPNCNLSAGQVIAADITATLGYGSRSQESSCKNNVGVQSSISLISNDTSGVLINTQPELTNSIELLTGRKDDFTPDSTVMCIKPNGNLLFAGYEYTPAANPAIIENTSTVVTPPSSTPTWKVGDYSYAGGSASGSSSTTSSCIGDTCPGSDNFAALVLSTSGSDTTNGAYSGAAINLRYTLKGAGIYSLVKDTSDLVSEDGLSGKTAQLSVTVGTLITAGGSTGYKATSGEISVTVDSKGKYYFTISSPIQLTKEVDVLGGVPNAPETTSFSMNNIHNHNP